MPLTRRLKDYLEFAASRPELFDTPPGGVRILLDPADIQSVEASVATGLVARGLSAQDAAVGLLFNDPWFYVVRDAVEFPDLSRRTHARIIDYMDHGVAALPVLEGKIVLVRHFRHATRRWMLEVPRGGVEPGQSPDAVVRAELEEEIGGLVSSVTRMGFLHGTTSLHANGAHLYFAELASVGEPQIGEGIASIEQRTVAEFEDMLIQGEILDSFTVAAYTHARLRGLL
jgi:ADP-ribose pyrophosphatase